MTLEALIKVRTSGMKPPSVWVLVGNVPKWVEDDAKTVIVCQPGEFDFRALVGLHVNVIEVESSPLMDKVLTAVDRAKPKSMNICGAAGTVGMGTRPMEKMRELLCNS